jgi:hypothetical protein
VGGSPRVDGGGIAATGWGLTMPRRPKLHLVGGSDPSSIFDDLTALRQEQKAPASRRRTRLTETFARIPHDRALILHRRLGGSACWIVLIELDRLILKSRGRNPVKFSRARLKSAGLTRQAWRLALRRLETAGAVRVETRGRGKPPWVTLLWYPQQD